MVRRTYLLLNTKNWQSQLFLRGRNWRMIWLWQAVNFGISEWFLTITFENTVGFNQVVHIPTKIKKRFRQNNDECKFNQWLNLINSDNRKVHLKPLLTPLTSQVTLSLVKFYHYKSSNLCKLQGRLDSLPWHSFYTLNVSLQERTGIFYVWLYESTTCILFRLWKWLQMTGIGLLRIS